MPPQNEQLLAADYFLAVEGMAMLRSCLTSPSATKPRVDDIRQIVTRYDEFPQSLVIPLIEHDVEEGYTRWAPTYDGPNPAIEIEEPILLDMLAALPPGVALDAATGTGRHATGLTELGHQVIGVDATDAMLDLARAKAPSVDFRRGRLEELPLDDDSVDLVTCALALTHVPDLKPVMREFSRVLRPGGTVLLSDMHPFVTMLGGMAAFPGEDITQGIPYVVNRTHPVSDYVAAFSTANLTVRDCIEPPVTEELATRFPSYLAYPDATRQAFLGTPYLLIWRLEN